MDGEINETHPLAFTSGSQRENPDILNHDEAMKSFDRDKFESSMAEEI